MTFKFLKLPSLNFVSSCGIWNYGFCYSIHIYFLLIANPVDTGRKLNEHIRRSEDVQFMSCVYGERFCGDTFHAGYLSVRIGSRQEVFCKTKRKLHAM